MILILALIWLAIITTPFIPDLLTANLENRYRVLSKEQISNFGKPVNILVLGGGNTNDKRLPATNKLSEGALARLAEGIRIHRQIPGSFLITSAAGRKGEITQAEVTRDAAIALGVNTENIKMQTLPKNTQMEATEYKRLFGDSAQLVLVTSAIHIPRAMILFRKAGLNPIPAPAHHMVKESRKRRLLFWLPASGNIKRMESAIHEYMGMLWDRMGGN